jgi:hypothetical protein
MADKNTSDRFTLEKMKLLIQKGLITDAECKAQLAPFRAGRAENFERASQTYNTGAAEDAGPDDFKHVAKSNQATSNRCGVQFNPGAEFGIFPGRNLGASRRKSHFSFPLLA